MASQIGFSNKINAGEDVLSECRGDDALWNLPISRDPVADTLSNSQFPCSCYQGQQQMKFYDNPPIGEW